MIDSTESGCINHPGKLAVNRCKQCQAPTCHPCTVQGPTGKFCSENCRATHEAFIQRARALDTPAPSTLFVKIRKLVRAMFLLALAVLIAGALGTIFDIPILSEATDRARKILGL